MAKTLQGIGPHILVALRLQDVRVPANIIRIDTAIMPDEVVTITYTCQADAKTLKALYLATQKLEDESNG